MKTFIMWSGGKDSTATVILAKQHNIPVDAIVFSEVMYDRLRNISGEDPDHIKFIREVAKPKFEEWGYKVEILRADMDYIDCFYHRIGSSLRKKPKKNNSTISDDSTMELFPMDEDTTIDSNRIESNRIESARCTDLHCQEGAVLTVK